MSDEKESVAVARLIYKVHYYLVSPCDSSSANTTGLKFKRKFVDIDKRDHKPMTTSNSEYRPKYIKIVITGFIVFLLINSISLLARGLFSKELLGATISPLILTIVSTVLGIWRLKRAKKNLAWGLILGAFM